MPATKRNGARWQWQAAICRAKAHWCSRGWPFVVSLATLTLSYQIMEGFV